MHTRHLYTRVIYAHAEFIHARNLYTNKLTAAVAIQVPQSRSVSTVMLSNPFLITGITKSQRLTSYNENNICVFKTTLFTLKFRGCVLPDTKKWKPLLITKSPVENEPQRECTTHLLESPMFAASYKTSGYFSSTSLVTLLKARKNRNSHMLVCVVWQMVPLPFVTHHAMWHSLVVCISNVCKAWFSRQTFHVPNLMLAS
jgi:hypothetical protein